MVVLGGRFLMGEVPLYLPYAETQTLLKGCL